MLTGERAVQVCGVDLIDFHLRAGDVRSEPELAGADYRIWAAGLQKSMVANNAV
jgi:hypothetical protein